MKVPWSLSDPAVIAVLLCLCASGAVAEAAESNVTAGVTQEPAVIFRGRVQEVRVGRDTVRCVIRVSSVLKGGDVLSSRYVISTGNASLTNLVVCFSITERLEADIGELLEHRDRIVYMGALTSGDERWFVLGNDPRLSIRRVSPEQGVP